MLRYAARFVERTINEIQTGVKKVWNKATDNVTDTES